MNADFLILRADPVHGDLHVIVLSTTLSSAEEQACHALGCAGFLLEPARHDEFLAALRRIGLTPQLDQPRRPETRLQ